MAGGGGVFRAAPRQCAAQPFFQVDNRRVLQETPGLGNVGLGVANASSIYYSLHGPADHGKYAGLHEADQRVVEILSGLLRIAAGLDRTRSAAVSRLRVDGGHEGRPLRILVETAPGADADLELYSARNRKDLLEAALGVAVEIEAVPPGMLRPAAAGAAG